MKELYYIETEIKNLYMDGWQEGFNDGKGCIVGALEKLKDAGVKELTIDNLLDAVKKNMPTTGIDK